MANEDDLVALLKRYVRQETVDPLRSVGRTLLFGVLGSLLLGTGAVLLAKFLVSTKFFWCQVVSLPIVLLNQKFQPITDLRWSLLRFLMTNIFVSRI